MLLSIFLIFGLGNAELILIVLVVFLLFGGKKIPELMKGLGQGVKSFKDGMQGIENDVKNPDNKDPDKEKEKEKTI